MAKVIEGFISGTKDTILGPDFVRVKSTSQGLYTSVSNSPGQDHPFLSEGYSGTGGLQNGKLALVNNFNHSPSGLYVTLLPGLVNNLDIPASVQAVLARTNPAKPSVQIPVFAFELKDMPDMLRQIGRFARIIYIQRQNPLSFIRNVPQALRDIAAINIAIQFGWRPFVSDLWKIVTFQDAVERRRKELEKLKSDRGLSKSTKFGTYSTTETRSVNANSDYGAFVNTVAHITHSVEVWGSARWVPTAGQTLPSSNGELRRQITGFSPDAILLNVWEALPWSWLADYFSNIGDVIGGANRTIATPVSGCIMRRRTTKAVTDPVTIIQDTSNPYTLSGGTFEWHQHARSTGSGFADSSSFPTLEANQLSILGSLTVLRAR